MEALQPRRMVMQAPIKRQLPITPYTTHHVLRPRSESTGPLTTVFLKSIIYAATPSDPTTIFFFFFLGSDRCRFKRAMRIAFSINVRLQKLLTVVTSRFVVSFAARPD